MSRIIFVLVLAVNAAFAQRNCDAQGANNPIHDVAVWMERAENATRQCDGDSRNILAMSIAAVYALSGDVDTCQTWLDTIGDESSFRYSGSKIAAIVSHSGEIDTAMEIAAKQKTELYRDKCYVQIGRVLAGVHRFDEARNLPGQIGDSNERNSLLRNIAENLAYAGKWAEAKTAMNQIESPTSWGYNAEDLIVDDEFVKQLTPIPVDDDPLMATAIAQARSHLDHFIKILTNPDPSEVYFSVRVLVEVAGESEHLWLGPVRYENGNFIGNIDSPPEKIASLKQYDEITISKDKASDWSYYRNPKLQHIGSFTFDAEFYIEDMADQWNTINQCEENKTVTPPEQQTKGVVAEYRKLAGMFTTDLTVEDLKSASARAAAFTDPEKRAAFWLKVAWHEIKAGNQNGARDALLEMVSATSEIPEPTFETLNQVLAADAYMELGDSDTAKALLEQAKSSEKQIAPLFSGFTSFTTAPLIVGVYVRAGDMDTIFSIFSAPDNKDTSSAWMAFGSYCVVYRQLEYVESHFEDLPTIASKANVALGVVEGLREVDGE